MDSKDMKFSFEDPELWQKAVNVTDKVVSVADELS